MKHRYLISPIRDLLRKKMVLLAGPRQVGKTTLALSLLGQKVSEAHPAYLNWDNPRVPQGLKRGELPTGEPLVILDEIHKFLGWRNLLKGLYDTNKSRVNFLVTGSARLDHYRRGGDSMTGRYNLLRLHPFSILEYAAKPTYADLERLLAFGGFPEPLFAADPKQHRMWQRQRLSLVVKDDLRDLERVKDISYIDQLIELLPEKVGSPLSIKSLKEDLQVDHKTVERWLTILENLYVCFRIPPFGSKKIRAVKKEQKLYLWDWSQLTNSGARFENLVASQLLKYCHFVEDTEGYAMELRYIRDTDKREADFVVIQNGKPLFAVESKTGESAVSPALRYFGERLNVPVYYQVHLGTRSFDSGSVRVRPFVDFCRETKMP